MNVSLTPQLKAIVQEKVASGMYSNASEVIRAALRLLIEQDQRKRDQLEILRAELAIGERAVEMGDFSDQTVEDIAREVKEEVKKKA